MSDTNKQLGYPPDARLLIINADDFGMCHAINAAIFESISGGVTSSTTLMVPCPWAQHAMRLLGDHPEIHFGVHLTAICDSITYRWRPLTSRERVPSLVDAVGFFHHSERIPEFLANATIDDLEIEFRAQIEAVLSAGLSPTHLDWHSLPIQKRPDMFDLMLGLAKEYRLALRVVGEESIAKVQGMDLPCNDHAFVDSFELGGDDKPAKFARLLHDLPAGLSEWAVHPGLDTAEMHAIEPDGDGVRQADYEFLVSAEAREMIAREGITVISYAPLQAAWRDRLV